MALRNGDVGPGRTVLDLGCGTGMLALGAALVGSDLVFGVDIDGEALTVAQSNVEELELQHIIQLIQAKVPYQPDTEMLNSLASLSTRKMSSKRQNYRAPAAGRSHRGRRSPAQRGGGRRRERDQCADDTNNNDNDSSSNPPDNNSTSDHTIQTPLESTTPNDESSHQELMGLAIRDKCVDTVLTNPPFGTKQNAGIDVQFLKEATRVARSAVYSFHKTSTRPFLLRTIQQWGLHPEVAAEMRFDLPNVYKFHRQGEVNIEVDLLRITPNRSLSKLEKLSSEKVMVDNETLDLHDEEDESLDDEYN